MSETKDLLLDGIEAASNTPIAPAHGIAAIALNLALKYHSINTVQDGALYQQYKLEGKNLRELHLDMVFETAIKIEQFLIASSERIATIIVDAITEGNETDGETVPAHAKTLDPQLNSKGDSDE